MPSPVEHRVTRGAFVDPLPPRGWTQCAGFVNTEGDDVDAHFLDGCLETERLRVRVFTARDELEEDVFVTGMHPEPAWRDNYIVGESTIVKNTFWGTTDGGAPSLFLIHTDGKDACLQMAGPPDTMTFGSGHAEKAIIVLGATGYDEYRISCGRENLPDRKIAIYR